MLTQADVDASRSPPMVRRRLAGGWGGPALPGAWPAVVALAVVGFAVLFVGLVRVRPAYDAYGWLVWGRQAAHLRLNTSAAPSWKPLTFLFTFWYALLLGSGAVWLWMVTAVAAGFAAPVLAARIAYRLTGPAAAPRYARVAASAFAAAGVLGIGGYWHFLLIATADPMIVALCLAAIDAIASGRPRAAWLLLVLASLGRPEASPLVLVFAVWAWRGRVVARPLLVGGIVAIPALWFGIPALTSYSWLIAGNVLDESTNPLAGNKVVAVMDGFTGLYELPMQLAVLFTLGLALVLRERIWLLMTGAAVVWLGVDVGLALHGSGIAPRYTFEPAAVLIVLAGAGLGRLLALEPHRVPPLTLRAYRVPLIRLAAIAALGALMVSLASPARLRGRLVHNGIELGRTWARQLDRLHGVIAADGGPKAMLACGQAVTEVSYQSILAWELDENVVQVGWQPQASIRRRLPILLFEPKGAGWQVRTLNSPAGKVAQCRRLNTTTALG
ncbi:MAG TPA: hypothetical protein VG325_16240 [Solirubrobacteraceae bacterium]|nr:hypothetical protein [Solirubrobacteraceae bacterium]